MALQAVEILTNQRITGRDSDKDVRHIELDLEGSGLEFEPGDSLGVIHRNPDGIVESLIDTLGFDGDTTVTGEHRDTTFRAVLTEENELTLLDRGFIGRYSNLIQNEGLRTLTHDDKRAELAAFINDRHVIDVVKEFPADVSVESFLKTLKKKTPRLYSIASSLSENPGEAHLTVDVLRFHAFGDEHLGAASNFLAAKTDDDSVEIYVERNDRFRLPKDNAAAVIMVGPGTGVAPFRGFVQQRVADGATGKNWLFFGARHMQSDFLYQLEWLRHKKNGSLDRLDAAFSRDQEYKIYVQDRMLENSRELYEWLENGAYFYLCGDGKHMARDVNDALIKIVAQEGALDDDSARDYVKSLKRSGRYQRDVY